MIGVVLPIRTFIKFSGGGDVHSKEVLSRLAKRTDILLLPPPSEIINNYSEIYNYLDKIPFNFPDFINGLKNENLSYSDILHKYSLYLNNVRIIYDFISYIHLDMTSKGSKAKLFIKSLSRDIYCNEMVSFDAYCIAKITNKPLVTTLQSEIRSYGESIRFLYGSTKYKIGDPLFGFKQRYNFLNIAKFGRILNDPIVKYVLAVSEGSLEGLKLKSEKIKVLKPGNAFNPDLLRFRTKNKENYLVFWARLYYLKGIFEIPYIMREIVKRHRDVKLLIFGEFINNIEKEKFFNLIKNFNLEKHIKWLGFISDEEKYKIVSKARALIYPSHVDSFSLVILESLALGTPVIAYDLPGPKSIYRDLKAVRFVREFDIDRMALNVLDILKMKDEDYFSFLIYNEMLDKFLERYNSWDKVTDEILTYLNK